MPQEPEQKLKALPDGLKRFRPLEHEGGPEKLAFPKAMSKPLVVALLDRQYEREGRSTVVLVDGFEYSNEETGRRIRVPRTYVTDFASVPWIVRGLIESFGRHARAAVVHDWLYAINEGERKDADKIALEIMKELGVGPLKRFAIYRAIRAFGEGGWKNMAAEWKITWADPKTGDRMSAKYKQSDFHGGRWPNDPELGF